MLVGIAAALIVTWATLPPAAAQAPAERQETATPASQPPPAEPAILPAQNAEATAQTTQATPPAAGAAASSPTTPPTTGELPTPEGNAPSTETTPAEAYAPPPTDAAAQSPVPPTGNDPGASPASPPSNISAVEAEELPRDLSPWNMFMSADIIVKAVMIGLILASVVTWTVWLAKSVELMAAKRRATRALMAIAQARSLDEAASLLQARRGVGPAFVNAASAELHASWNGTDKASIKERIGSHLERIELAAARDVNKGTGVLATIGATAPFVGLFGTVWGIMNSFIGISEAQTTNLAIVAPGIAEALLATAFGLVAAIPAVIFYNQLARGIGGYKAVVGDGAAAVLRLASRDLDNRNVRTELRAAAE
jgi:biopolymer transport protein ExbB